ELERVAVYQDGIAVGHRSSCLPRVSGQLYCGLRNGGRLTVKKIDVFPHIFPKPLLDKASTVAVEPALGQFKRNSGIPVLYDLDARFRAMDQFGDYVQVLTISNPPIESIGAPPASTELARMGNEFVADLVQKHPDRFVGFAASLPMNDVAGTLHEIDHAINDLGAP